MNDLDLVDDLYLAAEAALPDVLDLASGLADAVSRAPVVGPDVRPDRGADRATSREDELAVLAREAAAGDRVALEALLTRIRPKVLRDIVGGSGRRHAGGDHRGVCRSHAVPAGDVRDGVRVRHRPRQGRRHVPGPRPAIRPRLEFLDVLASESFEVFDVSEVRQLLDRLPEQQRGVLVLRIAMGFTAEETARVIGSTPGAVRVTQHRALARLRGLLDEQAPPSADG